MRKSKQPTQSRVLALALATISIASLVAACNVGPVSGDAPGALNGEAALEQARIDAQAANLRLANVERQTKQATASAQLRLRATDDALRLSQEKNALEVTRVANVQVAQATQIALDNIASMQRAQLAATAQAGAVAIRATTVSIDATATAVAIMQDNAQRSAEWERDVLIPAKTFITAGAGIAVAIVVLYLLVRFGFKMVDTWVLHARVFRDGRGNITIVTEPDKGGEMQYVQPHLSPAPVLSIGPRGQGRAAVLASAGDVDVTRRAQLVDTIQIGAAHGRVQHRATAFDGGLPQLVEPAIASARHGLRALLDEPRINVMSTAEIPAQIADENAIAAIDADWRSQDV